MHRDNNRCCTATAMYEICILKKMYKRRRRWQQRLVRANAEQLLCCISNISNIRGLGCHSLGKSPKMFEMAKIGRVPIFPTSSGSTFPPPHFVFRGPHFLQYFRIRGPQFLQ